MYDYNHCVSQLSCNSKASLELLDVLGSLKTGSQSTDEVSNPPEETSPGIDAGNPESKFIDTILDVVAELPDLVAPILHLWIERVFIFMVQLLEEGVYGAELISEKGGVARQVYEVAGLVAHQLCELRENGLHRSHTSMHSLRYCDANWGRSCACATLEVGF